MNHKNKRILVMTAVLVEKEAVLNGLGQDDRFDVVVAGVGPIAAAVTTTKALAAGYYDLVLSIGIGGGFPERAEVGSLVVASEIVGADLGVETPEGFCSLDELGFGSCRISTENSLVNKLAEGLSALTNVSVKVGPIITVSTATGTAESASELNKRVPGVAAEAMEGFGVALAAHEKGVPVHEIRAISNCVGPRDREAWRIKEALDSLKAASAILSEVL